MASARRAIAAYYVAIATPFSWELPLFFSFTSSGLKSRALHKHKRSAQQARAIPIRAVVMTRLQKDSSVFQAYPPLHLDTAAEFWRQAPLDTDLLLRLNTVR